MPGREAVRGRAQPWCSLHTQRVKAHLSQRGAQTHWLLPPRLSLLCASPGPSWPCWSPGAPNRCKHCLFPEGPATP